MVENGTLSTSARSQRSTDNHYLVTVVMCSGLAQLMLQSLTVQCYATTINQNTVEVPVGSIFMCTGIAHCQILQHLQAV